MTRKEFLIILIACLTTVVLWVIFDILHARAKVVEDPKVQELIRPINPNLGLEGLEFNE